MVNSSRSSKGSRSGRLSLWLFVIVALAIAATLYAYRAPINGYAQIGTSYAARVACSCRFVAGRDLGDCEKDKLAGMELITLVDNVETKSVTARFPLVTAHTARFREGYGCVLDEWEE